MILCHYGCGKKANFYFKTVGKWCCSESQNSCDVIRKKKSKKMMGERNPMYGVKRSFTKREIEKQIEGRRLTIKKLKNKYPFFCSIEEMRYNPDNAKEIQVRCKNHLCKNSKEQEGWFTPSMSQITERRRALEQIDGNDGRYFYCSEECKNVCPLYNLKSDTNIVKKLYYNYEEYKTFRQYVLDRDKYKCQYCGEKAEVVHHERPQKKEPFFSLDPDFAWSCCEKCHLNRGHRGECSAGKLASVVCI